MDIKMINSIEDLQSIFGKFKIAKLEISKILDKKIIARSWKDIYEKYIYPKKQEDLYFKDKISKYIFYLVELNGKLQLDFLGISFEHYKNKKVADKWHKEIAKIIHPDRCKHPKATEAMKVLENLYKGMIRKWIIC